MWRYFAGGAGALLLALAAMFLFRGTAAPEVRTPPPPPAVQAAAEDALPDEAPSATAKTREQKRFDRLDKDRNDSITRDEYFALRRKAFAKLDVNGDGKLSFDEWAVKGLTRFGGADKDKSGALNRVEFATTAVKRKAPARCACAPAAKPAAKAAPAAEDDGDGSE
jgi:hypothetical protein